MIKFSDYRYRDGYSTYEVRTCVTSDADDAVNTRGQLSEMHVLHGSEGEREGEGWGKGREGGNEGE